MWRDIWDYWREAPVRTTLEIIIFPILALVLLTMLVGLAVLVWQVWEAWL